MVKYKQFITKLLDEGYSLKERNKIIFITLQLWIKNNNFKYIKTFSKEENLHPSFIKSREIMLQNLNN